MTLKPTYLRLLALLLIFLGTACKQEQLTLQGEGTINTNSKNAAATHGAPMTQTYGYFKSAITNAYYAYCILTPANYSETGAPYPILFAFGGLGEFPTTTENVSKDKLTDWGPVKEANNGNLNNYPGIIVVFQGQKYSNQNYEAGPINELKKILTGEMAVPPGQPTAVINTLVPGNGLHAYNVNKNRIGLSGLSKGGQAVYLYLKAYPTEVASVSVASGFIPSLEIGDNVGCATNKLAAFVNDDDTQIFSNYPSLTYRFVNYVKACKGDSAIYIFDHQPTGGHNTWNKMYGASYTNATKSIWRMHAETKLIDTVAAGVKNIISVAAAPALNVAYGTAFSSLNLPTSVLVNYSDTTSESRPVTWLPGNYSATSPGTYTLSGTISLASGTSNASNIFATVNITVQSPAANALTITSLSPTNNSIVAATNGTTLTATFNYPIKKGTGTFLVKNITAGRANPIDINSATVKIVGNKLEISPVKLYNNSVYAFQLSPGAIKDMGDNSFAGITDDVTWTINVQTAPSVEVEIPLTTSMFTTTSGVANKSAALLDSNYNTSWTIDYPFPASWTLTLDLPANFRLTKVMFGDGTSQFTGTNALVVQDAALNTIATWTGEQYLTTYNILSNTNTITNKIIFNVKPVSSSRWNLPTDIKVFGVQQ